MVRCVSILDKRCCCFRRNKKKQEDKLYFLIWELIALALVAIVIIVAVRGIVNNSSYWKKYYSSDLGLMADLANTNQGDFSINYVQKPAQNSIWSKIYFIDNKMFEIDLKPDRVETYDYPKESLGFYLYPFAKNKMITVIPSSTVSDFLVFTKFGPKFTITNIAQPFSGGPSTSIDECASLQPVATQKDMSLLNFASISLDGVTSSYASPVNDILRNKLPNAPKDKALTIIFAYANSQAVNASHNSTIYYSDDAHSMLSKKLACLIKGGLSSSAEFSSLKLDVLAYDGFASANQVFSGYVSSKPGDEFWIIMSLNDDIMSKNIDKNRFAGVIRKAVEDNYS